MTMIERVARAICRAGICGPKDHLNEQENAYWRKFELEARAAIGAMREPTEEMIKSGALFNSAENDLNGYNRAKDNARVSWQAMIGEALK